MRYFSKNSYNFIVIYISNYNKKMVRLLGFEPRTSWSVAKRSIQLSYRRKFKKELPNIVNDKFFNYKY